MPSRALTIILNTNHSKRTTVLRPYHADESPQAWILQEANNKFRTRNISQVFLHGGEVLEPSVPIDEKITQVWVSKGEEYCGPPPIKPAREDGSRAEVRVIRGRSIIDNKAVKQLETVAELPHVHVVAGMPDLHPGNRFPIGCSVVADGVYPALIGSDVGCGIALYHLSAKPSRLSPSKLAERLRNLDSAWEGDVAAWLAQYGITRPSSFDASALGTVGGGNHFAELCTVETIVDADACNALELRDTELYLLVHTGSRGLGASILDAHTSNESNPYFSPDSELLQSYIAEHDYAVQWAIANRDLVAHRISQCILSNPLDEDGVEIAPSGPPSKDALRKVIDVTHNSAVQSSLVISGERKDVWIHRKGAAPTDKGVTPCPGSRGDFSWLLMPTGDGEHNAQSLPHGAGRLHARSTLQAQQARRPVARSSLLTTQLGSEVVCTDPALLIEEAPTAYKNVQTVVDDMEWAGCARGVAVLRPVVTYKTREAGERR